MDTEKVNELSELFSAATITTQAANEHLPYTTITLVFHARENADLCFQLMKELADEQGIIRS